MIPDFFDFFFFFFTKERENEKNAEKPNNLTKSELENKKIFFFLF